MQGTITLVIDYPITYECDDDELITSDEDIRTIINKDKNLQAKINRILEDGWDINETIIE